MALNPITLYYRPGQYIFHEGETSHCMYVVKEGTVGIRKRKGGAYVEIARVYANEVLGELSFFDRNPRSASAVAISDVEVLEIKFESLDRIYAGVPDYMKTIIACVAERLRKANDTIRRLQKEVVFDEMEGDGGASSGGAADVMAATENILSDEVMAGAANYEDDPEKR